MQATASSFPPEIRDLSFKRQTQALPFKGRVGWGWCGRCCGPHWSKHGMATIPLPASPLKGEEKSSIRFKRDRHCRHCSTAALAHAQLRGVRFDLDAQCGWRGLFRMFAIAEHETQRAPAIRCDLQTAQLAFVDLLRPGQYRRTTTRAQRLLHRP